MCESERERVRMRGGVEERIERVRKEIRKRDLGREDGRMLR